ncbi:ATP-dependent DNA helicase RecG [Massilimicrobiota sp. An105]|jgi:ATP-dependent DNA helicase recG|uniref:ATP-dependent DNA helicase RecG n=1 Tax=Massilimicrobiota sp. An105 TaxID=1965540 RepID=UPI000B3A5BBB|nr:ATP-dependent DNA helicase RecG [Massilimicrobiota sp. An105]OUQ84934.1 ATP-dependent DNA helicase RecG [Massilimicrobiota sp. An105]
MTDIKLLKTTSRRLEILASMNITTLEDLIYQYPYRYEVIEEKYPTDEDEHLIIEATVISPVKIFFKGKMSRMSFEVEDKYLQHFQVSIFNRHFLRQHLKLGTTITIIGKCINHRITASDIKIKPLQDISGIYPVYSLKEGITQKSFRQYVKKALSLLNHEFDDFIPEKYRIQHHLIRKESALYCIHFPENKKDVQEALKYLKYEEFLKFQLTMQLMKQQRTQEMGIAKDFDVTQLQSLILSLPFALTKDQQTAIKEIVEDLKSPQMMYRFLQGDVGSGKTVVSSVALYANYLAGYQGALMAPTEILATQHYQTLSRFFENTDVHIELLTGSLSLKEKERVYQAIQSGEADIVVGTHALFQKKVVYHNLGFVITDEQHRFGVMQRKALKNKGQQVDFLIMSATPIPRTLAISMYGDMDVSTIKTMPQGRLPVKTQYIHSSSMKPILKHLKSYLAQGGQCYVICPLVEDSENLEAKSASQIAKAMQKYFQTQYNVGLLHGQMKEDEKEKVMNGFLNNTIQILVSTTVVEVGVDVKNANMMVIYNAERFGMSQLHQLRGRIGRGQEQAYCYLMSSSSSKEAIERLKYLEKSHDGFEISLYDLKLRGPGEVLGQRQSGLPTFLVADIMKDFPILSIARKDADEIIHDYIQNHEYQGIVCQIQEKLQVNNEYVD